MKIYYTSQSAISIAQHKKIEKLKGYTIYHNQHDIYVYAKSRAEANRICKEKLGITHDIFMKNYSSHDEFEENHIMHQITKLFTGVVKYSYSGFISFDDLAKGEKE